MGWLLGVRMGLVSMARYLGGGHVEVLKARGKGIYWQAMRVLARVDQTRASG